MMLRKNSELFNGGGKALPAVDEVDRIESLPLTQMVVCGRSGSMFLHALLDGHPEVLQIPHTFKFYDFLAANPDFQTRDGFAIAKAFVEFPVHAALFDSDKSVLMKGRLGPEKDTRLLIDTQSFHDCLAQLMAGSGHGPRRILSAILVAYAWCVGMPIERVTQTFVHVHHGDWLWPNAVVEDCNLQGQVNIPSLKWLSPQRLIFTVRNPSDQIRSYEGFVVKVATGSFDQTDWMERYLRLLVQDWLRVELATASGIALHIVRLEDLRCDMAAEMIRLCAWMGISSNSDTLKSPTILGVPWWGDIYGSPSLTLNPPEPIQSPDALNRDHRFVYSLAGGVIYRCGYPKFSVNRLTSAWAEWWASMPKRPWPMEPKAILSALLARKSFLKKLSRRHLDVLDAIQTDRVQQMSS